MEYERNIIDEFLDQKIKEIEAKETETVEEKEIEQNEEESKELAVIEPKKNRKGLAVSIIALILAGMTAIGCFIGLKKKKNQPEEIVPSISTSTIVSIDELGKEEEMPKKEENKQYGKTTGNIKKEELVEKNGNVYKNQAAANKSSQVGKVQTDLKNDTLKIDKDGDVVEKKEDYIVQNEQGMVISQGSNESGIPEGHMYADATYYDKTGNVVITKGELININDFYRLQQYLTTTPNQTTYPTYENSYNTNYNEPVYNQPTYNEPTYNEPTYNEPTYVEPSYNNNNNNTSNYNGVINSDGTFTIDGVTFIDKATYEAIILGEYNEQDIRYNNNGVIYLHQNEYQNVR